jgi:hypothetical protein
MASRVDDAKRWRDRAEEALAIAHQMSDAECKRILLAIANAYAQLARTAEARKSAKAR